jgi:allantoinase
MTPEFAIASRRVVLPEGIQAATLVVRYGTIADIVAGVVPAARDVGDRLVLPGLVDTHVHVNEPGRTEWEGFATLTRAAAAGGVTTLVDMPLNSIPATTSAAALEAKRAAAGGQAQVDVGFWGGLVPDNLPDIRPLIQAGARGLKAFQVDSGVEEFPAASIETMDQALAILEPLGAPLLVHAEDPVLVAWQADRLRESPRSHAAWAASRVMAEESAIDQLVAIAEKHAARLHVVHVSTAGGVERLRKARARGVPITGETCPHYLVFRGEEVPDGATRFKCAPPLGSQADREALWAGLADGTLGMIVSDHSPCPPDLKCQDTGRFDQAWGGIASLEVSLPATWTEALARGYGPEDVAEWMAAAPARLAGLDRKGSLAIGKDADIVVLDPDATFVVEPEALCHRHAVTPYAGRTLRGVVETTWLRGTVVFDRRAPGQGRPSTPAGRLL